MNKQGSGKIEWTDYTWNPITGCVQGCDYCYARKVYERFKKSFKPSFHPKRLNQPLSVSKKRIFVCSTGDFFGKGVLPIWREEVYNVMKATDNTYQILTKQPQNISDLELDHIPDNAWLGVTVTSRKDQWRIRALEEKTSGGQTHKIFISYEPMLDWIDIIGDDSPVVHWFILGALTGSKAQPCPNIEGMISYVLDWGSLMGRKVFMKQSLKPYVKKLIQEFPKK